MRTGAELRAARLTKGWGLRDLARRTGITHRTVAYWEAKPALDRLSHAVKAMAKVLGVKLRGEFSDINVRARHRVLVFSARVPKVAAPRRVTCGARTRKGTLCRAKSEPGRKRCRFHGGCSTGPRTPEGRAAVAEAQRKRWARWQAERDDLEASEANRNLPLSPAESPKPPKSEEQRRKMLPPRAPGRRQ